MSAPRLLLGLGSLSGLGYAPHDKALEAASRLHEPESLAVTLVKAVAAGADAIFAPPSAALRHALAALRESPPVMPRLPLAPEDEDLSDTPFLLAGDSGVGALIGGAGDLGGLVARRLERDATLVGAKRLAGVVIGSPVTDLALAAGNARFFARLVPGARGRFAGPVGFETANLGLLLARLAEWGLLPDFVLGSVNPAGLGMRPSRETVLAEIAMSRIPVVATDLRGDGRIPLAEGAAYARAQGVHGLVVDVADSAETAVELRALGGTALRV